MAGSPALSIATHEVIYYGIAMTVIAGVFGILKSLLWEKQRKQRKKFYNEEYLPSDDWKRKRHVVLKRDNWECVHCGDPATQVHHKRYARRKIGKEPIEWLVSVCAKCHAKQHE